jgi:hypothetical protein
VLHGKGPPASEGVHAGLRLTGELLHLKISMLGSVYGLYAGLKRSLGRPRRMKNWCSVPMRSPSVSPRSQTSPSTCATRFS